MLNTIDGWGDGLETGTGNYKDGYFYVTIYNSTDSDRDDQVVVFSDQNNASSTTLDLMVMHSNTEMIQTIQIQKLVFLMKKH